MLNIKRTRWGAMGNKVYGQGFHDGRRSVFAELRAAADAARLRQHANRVDMAAGVIGSVIAQLIPVVTSVAKNRRRSKEATDSA